MKNVRVFPLARKEVLKAAKHCDQFSESLGDGLVEEFRYALDQLSHFPLSMPIFKRPIRKRPLFRFPYNIFYRVKGRNNGEALNI